MRWCRRALCGGFRPNRANLTTIRHFSGGFGAKGAAVASGGGVGPGPEATCGESGLTRITIQIIKIGEEVLAPSCVCVDGMAGGRRGIKPWRRRGAPNEVVGRPGQATASKSTRALRDHCATAAGRQRRLGPLARLRTRCAWDQRRWQVRLGVANCRRALLCSAADGTTESRAWAIQLGDV